MTQRKAKPESLVNYIAKLNRFHVSSSTQAKLSFWKYYLPPLKESLELTHPIYGPATWNLNYRNTIQNKIENLISLAVSSPSVGFCLHAVTVYNHNLLCAGQSAVRNHQFYKSKINRICCRKSCGTFMAEESNKINNNISLFVKSLNQYGEWQYTGTGLATHRQVIQNEFHIKECYKFFSQLIKASRIISKSGLTRTYKTQATSHVMCDNKSRSKAALLKTVKPFGFTTYNVTSNQIPIMTFQSCIIDDTKIHLTLCDRRNGRANYQCEECNQFMFGCSCLDESSGKCVDCLEPLSNSDWGPNHYQPKKKYCVPSDLRGWCNNMTLFETYPALCAENSVDEVNRLLRLTLIQPNK